jgi:lysylphosphatidylglycerol synthetase-like protein (DUF2156 family)
MDCVFPNRSDLNRMEKGLSEWQISQLPWLILRWSNCGRLALEPALDRSVIRAIIDRFGCDPLDEFAMLPDKSYWLRDDRQLFFAYPLWRNFVVCLVGPVGPPDLWLTATQEFLRFCAVQDWEPVFYLARPNPSLTDVDSGVSRWEKMPG